MNVGIQRMAAGGKNRQFEWQTVLAVAECFACSWLTPLHPQPNPVADGVCVYRGVPMMTSKGAVTATIANAWVK